MYDEYRKEYMKTITPIGSYEILDWYELDKKAEQEWIDKARERFEIREFVERRNNVRIF